MVVGFPEVQKNAGLDTNDGGDSRLSTLSDKFKRCTLQNVIQQIDIFGKMKSNYVERRKRDNLGLSGITMITTASYKYLAPTRHFGGSLDEKMSRLSMVTKVSSLYPGHDVVAKRRRMRKFQKVVVK